jgi:hypothetical protein
MRFSSHFITVNRKSRLIASPYNILRYNFSKKNFFGFEKYQFLLNAK